MYNYLDHAAATPVDKAVLSAMLPYMSEQFFNPSSPYAPAVQVRRDYESAKARLATSFGARADECVVTAGATESINLAFSSSTGHVVTSAIEHDAVLAVTKSRNRTLVQPTNKGIITPGAVQSAITESTDFLSIQLANNEIGTIQPIRSIASVVDQIRSERLLNGNSTPLLFHCDASQGFGQIDVHTARLGVDMLTLNAGKMYGPKQVALLWAKPGVKIEPQIVGGGQERSLRSGTENVAGVIGFAVAAERAAEHRKVESERLRKLRDMIQAKLKAEFSGMIVSGYDKKRLPGSLHVSFPGIDAERLVFALESKGVLVATGSACAANKGTRSHVLEAIGMSEEEADGSLRITLGKLNTEEGCIQAVEDIIQVVKLEKLRTGNA